MNQLIITEDGSHSLYHPDLDETYHSRHGAITESRHVFIQHGLDYWVQKSGASSVRVFEVGFGTGLNALLTQLRGAEAGISIEYVSIEAYPLGKEFWSVLNYDTILGVTGKLELLHQTEWNIRHTINEVFILTKVYAFLDKYKHDQLVDVIYFDAFAPSHQPELWTIDIFRQMYAMLAPKGILVTYCAKGQVKRDLRTAGFIVESLPGPPGKREMVRASKV